LEERCNQQVSTQALNLRHFGHNGALRLERICSDVRPADSGNIEAQAARHYWKHLLSPSWKRVKHGATDPLNARLNYGYAVLRALVARELAAAGLQPGLGLGHCNLENPFNLADDFMEPYRYLVERRVLETGYDAEFDGQARVAVLGFLESEVRLGEKVYRMPVAVSETVASFIRVLEGKSTPRCPAGNSMQVNSWRVMWVLAVYDTPVATAEDRARLYPVSQAAAQAEFRSAPVLGLPAPLPDFGCRPGAHRSACPGAAGGRPCRLFPAHRQAVWDDP